MAVTNREILLVVKLQNQAKAAIREFTSDMQTSGASLTPFRAQLQQVQAGLDQLAATAAATAGSVSASSAEMTAAQQALLTATRNGSVITQQMIRDVGGFAAAQQFLTDASKTSASAIVDGENMVQVASNATTALRIRLAKQQATETAAAAKMALAAQLTADKEEEASAASVLAFRMRMNKQQAAEAVVAAKERAAAEAKANGTGDVAAGAKYLASLKAQADAIGKTKFQLLALKAEQLGVAGAAGPMIKALEEAAASQHKFSLATILSGGSIRELATLIRELTTGGGLSRFFGSLSIEIQRLGLLPTIIKLALNPLVLLGAAALGVAVALDAASTNAARLQATIQGVGRLQGNTLQGLIAGAKTAAQAADISIGKAKEVETQLIETGKFSDGLASKVTGISTKFAAALNLQGKEGFKKAIEELGKGFADPAKGAEEFNQKLGFLSATELEHIKNLQAQGDLIGAQNELYGKLQNALAGVEVHLGVIGGLFHNIGEGISFATSKFGDFFKNLNDPAIKVADLTAKVQNLQQLVAAGHKDPFTQALLADYSNQLAIAQKNLATIRQQTADAKSKPLSIQGLDLVEKLDPDSKALQNLINQKVLLDKVLKDPGAVKGLGEKAGEARKEFQALSDTIGRVTVNADGKTYITQAQRNLEITNLQAKAARSTDAAEKGRISTQIALLRAGTNVVTNEELKRQATADGALAQAQASKGDISRAESLSRQLKALQENATGALALAAAYLKGDDEATIAEARRKAAVEIAGKGIKSQTAYMKALNEETEKQIALAVNEGIGTGAKKAAQLRDQAAAQKVANDAVRSGALSYAEANDLVQLNTDLHALEVLKLHATADQMKVLNAVIQGLTKSYHDNNVEKAISSAQSQTKSLTDQTDQLRVQLRTLNDTVAVREKALALAAAEQQIKNNPNLDPNGGDAKALRDAAVAQAEVKTRLSSAQYLKSFTDGIKEEIATMQIEQATYGHSQIYIDAYTKYQQALNKARIEGIALTPQEITAIRESVEAFINAEKEKEKAQSDWAAGAKSAFRQYVDDAKNAADQVKGIFTDAFRAAEDAFVDFTHTGKLDWKTMLQSIGDDITRFAFRQTLSTLFKKFLGDDNPLAALFGGSAASKSGGGPLKPDGSAFNPLYVKVVQGALDALSGGSGAASQDGGILGKLFSLEKNKPQFTDLVTDQSQGIKDFFKGFTPAGGGGDGEASILSPFKSLFSSLGDGFKNIFDGTLHNLGGLFNGLGSGLSSIFSSLGNMLGGSGGGGGGGFGSIFSGLGSLFSSGGASAASSLGDLSAFAGLFAGGGQVMGPGTATSDSIIAMLSNGEYVINAKSAAKHRALLEAVNKDILPAAHTHSSMIRRYATGGFVSGLSSPTPTSYAGYTPGSSQNLSSSTRIINVSVNQTIVANDPNNFRHSQSQQMAGVRNAMQRAAARVS